MGRHTLARLEHFPHKILHAWIVPTVQVSKTELPDLTRLLGNILHIAPGVEGRLVPESPLHAAYQGAYASSNKKEEEFDGVLEWITPNQRDRATGTYRLFQPVDARVTLSSGASDKVTVSRRVHAFLVHGGPIQLLTRQDDSIYW